MGKPTLLQSFPHHYLGHLTPMQSSGMGVNLTGGGCFVDLGAEPKLRFWGGCVESAKQGNHHTGSAFGKANLLSPRKSCNFPCNVSPFQAKLRVGVISADAFYHPGRGGGWHCRMASLLLSPLPPAPHKGCR